MSQPIQYEVNTPNEDDALMVFKTFIRDEIVSEECPLVQMRYTDLDDMGKFYQVMLVNYATGFKDELVLYLDDLIETGCPFKDKSGLFVTKYYPGVNQ